MQPVKIDPVELFISAKEVWHLFVCLTVSNFIQKILIRYSWKFSQICISEKGITIKFS